MIIDVDDIVVEHFGTKGMRWGVRKSPEEVKAKREVKAKKYVKKADEIQGKIDKLSPYSYRVHELREQKKTALDDAERKRQGKLSKRQKQVAIGAGAAATIIAAYGTYQTLNSGNARRLITKGQRHITGKSGLPWKRDPSLADPNLDVDGIMSKVVHHVNPKYGETGTKQNCRRATYAYEMRRRGYDVQATRTVNARGQDVTGAFNALHPGVNLVPPGRTGIATRIIGERNKWSKPFTEEVANFGLLGREKVDSPSNLHNLLSLQPDGARGEVGMQWFGGGGHSMAWEKIKGQVVVFDNQTGQKYVGKEGMDGFLNSVSDVGFTRLDNLPVNDDFLMRWLKDA